MAKIQLVVEIDERLYKNIIDNDKDDEEFEAMDVAFCNAKPLPKGHGRLIDADEFDSRIRVAGGMAEEELTEDFKDGILIVLDMMKRHPTIIEADKEG